MEYKGYVARVQLDEHAGVFHGEVVNIRDVITFEGSTIEELRQAFEDSIEDYLAFCAERGEAPLTPGIDRTALSLAPLFDDSDEKAYWLSRTPHERLRHVERLRRMNYGARATARLQRVLEIARQA